ncbi:MAG: hypothetical protein ACI9DF_004068 [Verrucomicrobiales bacterium]|jgi:hypothetical protein
MNCPTFSQSLACASLVWALSAVVSPAESIPIWVGGGAELEVEDVYTASNDPVVLKVHFRQGIEVASLDRQDIWVVSRNGFNQLARFVNVEREIDPLAIEDGVEVDDSLPEFWPWVMATYHVNPTDADGWTEEDSGRYAVLLEPNQVQSSHAGFLGAQLLGDFQMAVGETPPIKAKVDLQVEGSADGHQVAYSVFQFANPYYVLTDDGVVSREGDAFTIDVAAAIGVFVREPDEAILELRNDLGTPDPGIYSLTFQVNGQHIHSISFQVREENPEIPAGAKIEILREEEKVIARVGVEIEPNDDGSIYEIADWGEPRREGNTIYLDATAVGPNQSLNTDPVFYENDYCLTGDDDDDDGRPIDFKTLELIPEWLRPEEQQQLVFRTEEDWNQWVTENFPPNIRAAQPGPPVDFDEHTVIAVFAGETEQGIDIFISEVTDHGSYIEVAYVTTLPGILPEDRERVRPGHMIAIPKTKQPVRFSSDVIAFPTPLPVEPIPGEEAGPPPVDLAIAAQEIEPGTYTVVFRINGTAFANESFEIDGNRSIPARASIEVTASNVTAAAQVDVTFTGVPYHTISDWGPVLRRENHFILDAQASEIQFVQDPGVYTESHTYRLPLYEDREPIDFQHIDLRVQREQPLNVIIQTREEWWSLIGFEPGPLVLPAPDPVDFGEYTLIAVFSGAKPNGCYGVKIQDVLLENGVINVSYSERVPGPDEFCTQAIVYPSSAVSILKTDTPIDFITRPYVDLGAPIPVNGPPGDGSGADPLPAIEVEESLIAGRGPIYTVEFRMNGETYARTSFRGSDVFFVPDPDSLPEPFIQWLDHFLPEVPPSEAGVGGEDDGRAVRDAAQQKSANHDGDRWTDFEEFLLGLNPTDPNEPSAIWTDWVKDDQGEGHFAICFNRRKGSEEMADFLVEASQDLKVWVHDPALVQEPIIREVDADLEEVTICLTASSEALEFPFVRLHLQAK